MPFLQLTASEGLRSVALDTWLWPQGGQHPLADMQTKQVSAARHFCKHAEIMLACAMDHTRHALLPMP